ncbi:methyltransferase [Candidatus Scalindua japonica]|uniref:Methyltransferase n=1 Tax=Candidatus Scalindua japonica TaxID=1284222 RepID=A0A286TX13_9BACT|nr:methyltransferase domain-containing protein [Candidatus Scalindua japonica]GAX60416.1 methyltransferase [Candidatus Scalindua japonica]
MFDSLLDLLICPGCQGRKLKLNQTEYQQEEIWKAEILCENCSRSYPIIDGIPCMLNREQLDAQQGDVLQEWAQKVKDIDKDIVDADMDTYKHLCRKRTGSNGVSEDAERLLWEKKLFIDNQVLKEEIGDKLAAKWMVEKKNLQVRNNHVFRFLDEIDNQFEQKWILNVGPGVDEDLISRLELKGINLINLDIILEPLINLRSKSRECMCADIKSLPFDNGTFDAVFCFHVIHHAHPIEQALSEVGRVLKTNGKVFITEINPNHFVSFQGKLIPRAIKRFIRKCARKHVGTNSRIYKPSPFEEVIPRKVLMNAMIKTGFDNITRKTVVHAPQCFPDAVISIWNKMGFKFPTVFDPIAFEYMFFGKKSRAETQPQKAEVNNGQELK